MTTETEQPNDFAAFEAAANAEPETETETPNPEVNDELELTEEDELVEGEEEAEGDKKPRHKSAKTRIDELTKARREAERRNIELEQRLAALEGGHKPAEQPATLDQLKAAKPDPNDPKYEFGSADEQYVEDLADWKVEVKLAERDTQAKHREAQEAAFQTIDSLDTQWAEKATRGAEKYDDFDEAIQTYQTELPKVPPLMNAAIQGSPVGDDVAYHLGKNPTDAKLLAAELMTGTQDSVLSACRRFGEIEGQFLDKEPTMPVGGGPMDMAHYAGQLRGYANRAAVNKVTNAPVPPSGKPIRGAGGKFTKDTADMSFAEFEAHAKRAAG